MIAPIRQFMPRRRRPPRGLASARRAVAAVLFDRAETPAPVDRPRLATYRTWAILVTTATMAAIMMAYFALGPW